MYNIILVDDHSIFREVLKLFIETEELGEIVGEAENGLAFLELLDKSNLPDLVIMDMEMPIMGGIRATQLATNKYPGLKILIFSMQIRKANFMEAYNSGAMGFLSKSSGIEELETAIKTIMNGGFYFPKDIILSTNTSNKTEKEFIQL